MEKIADFEEGMKATTEKNHFDASLRDRYFRRDKGRDGDIQAQMEGGKIEEVLATGVDS